MLYYFCEKPLQMDARLQAFERLLTIMDDLREKCPWDKKQTLESLRYLSIEEMYELSDAILTNDLQEVKKELGDLMLHLVFYAKIASETNQFDITDVLNGICDKLVHRHPHIYGDVKVTTEEEVKHNWEKLKLKEGKKSVLEGVPRSLPAMVKAVRIQEKARGVGFDWDNSEQVWEKVEEELEEFKEELSQGDKEKTEQEFGDLLFSMIILIMSVFGMKKGFVESFTDFLNLVVGIALALLFYVDLSFLVSQYISLNATIIIIFSITIIFLMSIIALRLLTSLLLFLLDGGISAYKNLNMVLGFILGGIKGITALILFAGIFEKYISGNVYQILYDQSKILVLLEPFKDYIFK